MQVKGLQKRRRCPETLGSLRGSCHQQCVSTHHFVPPPAAGTTEGSWASRAKQIAFIFFECDVSGDWKITTHMRANKVGKKERLATGSVYLPPSCLTVYVACGGERARYMKNGMSVRQPRRKVAQKQGYVVKLTGVFGEDFTGYFELHTGRNSAVAAGSVAVGEQ